MTHSHIKYSKMVALILSFILAFSSIVAVFSESKASAAISPVGPTNLRVTDVSAHTVTLEWDPIPGVNDYWVWNSNNGYVTWASGSTKEVGGLTAETEYSFFIGQDGVQAAVITPEQKSNLVTFTTLPEDPEAYPTPPLTPPHNLRIADITDSTVSLSWGSSPDATGYDIYVNNGWASGTWDNAATTYTYTAPFVAGSVYTFMVGAQRSVNGLTDVSSNSNKVSITWGQLAAPKDLQVVTATRTSASLGWAPTPGATSYDIFINSEKVGSSESNHYVATGLTEGQSYLVKVVANNSVWTSPSSSEITVVPGSQYTIITYYTSWSINETGRNFKPSDIDVSQITHINYAFSDICWRGYGTGGVPCQSSNVPLQNRYVFDGEMIVGDPEVDLNNFAALNQISQQNPHLKLMVSVGGWSWSKNFSNMAATEETRRAFTNSVVKFLREYGLDGLDIDWEYPVEGGDAGNSRKPEDKENFLLLVKMIREALDAAGSEDGSYYLLTIAAGQSDAFVNNADLQHSSQYLDFINMMAYDYSGSWESLAHHNAPLYYDDKHPKDFALRNNIAAAITSFLDGGVPSYKLVMGIPFYGKGWRGCPEGGQYETCEGGEALPGQFGTWESQIFDFSAIENNYLNKDGNVRYWNEASKVPYLYNSTTKDFISYDDQQTIMYKASYIKSLDLAGAMSWEISGDRNRTLSTQLLNDLPINGVKNPSAIAAPTNLAIDTASTNSIFVKWTASSHTTGYDVFVNQKWVGYTTESQFLVPSLAASTEYKIYVVAVNKGENDLITGVSVASNVIKATTATPQSSYVIIPPPADTTLLGDPAATKIKTTSTTNGDKTSVSLSTAEAIKSIEDSTSTKFQIVVGTKRKKLETTISKQVIQAIAKKGKNAVLSIVTNEAEQNIPISALTLGNDITDIIITIQAPEQDVTDKINNKAKSTGAKSLLSPLEVKIVAVDSGKVQTAITISGASYVSTLFKLNKKDIDIDRATGVIYIPETNEYRHVPTLFTINSDGTVTAQLKGHANGIYTIIETKFDFPDVIAEWYKKDITLATSSLIVSGTSEQEFGVNQEITRAEFVSIIVKALGIAPTADSSTFKDVGGKTEFATEVEAAVKSGLIKGRSSDKFDPDGSITRQELAAILENVMKYNGVTSQADPAILKTYKDQAKVSSFAKAALALMVDQQIIVGVTPTKLDPLSNVTKAQAIVTVMRMLRILNLSN
ncbi:hypothetical protein KCTCHS21_43950 [Cohnella abietis]|uniref:chitinase n=1 Tax=Cohnella abietis TaxID=2507935 RepID=A0A3T1DA55_9BACL|nr:hypothetical protein KCTCHS21_43950 [Cohnella abietis]